jgi:hypothetical protein
MVSRSEEKTFSFEMSKDIDFDLARLRAGRSGRGYTDESLRMLDSEEGQTNAVFACFGSAAQHAQLFEQSLARFLVVYNRIASSALAVEDFDAYEQKLQKKTMGWLLDEVSKQVTFTDDVWPQRLDAALECRNYLMHTFFLKVADGFKSEAGRLGLLGGLLAAERLLDNARITLNAMRIAMCETLGVADIE